MIKIHVKNKPITDSRDDLYYNMNCMIKIPEDASLNECMYGWFRALEIEGYSPTLIREMKDKLDL